MSSNPTVPLLSLTTMTRKSWKRFGRRHRIIRNIIATIMLPAAGLWYAPNIQLTTNTAIWALVYYFLSGIGITAGYHRLWSHRSYSASSFLELYLALAGAACFQGSIREWSRDHRAHHRYVDTDRDPYSISKGISYAHMGWLIIMPGLKQDKVDVSDLDSNRIVVWQHRNFTAIAIIVALKGGSIYAGILRMFFFQQATFCVNSLAHWLGDQPYDDRHSPQDHLFTTLITFGEGYHNFHHTFPSDYRNGVTWYQYDPTKWFIWSWKKAGLASDLHKYTSNLIGKCEYEQQQKQLDQFWAHLNWGVPHTNLPLTTWASFQQEICQGRELVVLAGLVTIRSYVGKDATSAFNGGVYAHSTAAHKLLDDLCVGILLGGVELTKNPWPPGPGNY
ncbi:hypothetical protein BDV26DRAFT_278443 [Aspergillus bertholletiae]|uniref:Uncharacterized protein n=1 Tax=Aspergillus bertholletiae TaxID=1226010 RepID=A0A5N7BJ71_9EURO|nr:hypothetical protein BDV26DRAFT_278443 [Aspergillus bertholletiae]